MNPTRPALSVHLHATVPTHAPASPRVAQVAAMFGLGLDDTRTQTIVPPTTLTLQPHQLLFITGPSGSGKSTLLRTLHHALKPTTNQSPGSPASAGVHVLNFNHLPAPPANTPIIDAIGTTDANPATTTLPHALHCLATAGLNDAFVLLRTVDQLSDGQRDRFRFAQLIHAVESLPTDAWAVVLADEFGTRLDRPTAHALARSARRWCNQQPVCVVAATTHDDLLEPLQPDTLLEQHPGGTLDLHTRTPAARE